MLRHRLRWCAEFVSSRDSVTAALGRSLLNSRRALIVRLVMNLENMFIYFLLGGAVIVLLGHLLFVIAGFRQSTGWGFAVLCLPPLGGLALLFKHFRRALIPLLVMLIGGALVGAAYAPALMGEPKKDPIVRVEKGDVQLTVTAAENFDYATIADYPHLSMLQMANPEVTDATLQHLRGMNKLKNLDVSNSKITDDGLKFISELPALEELRLTRTGITDQGFREHLLGKETLMKLDLTGTKVSRATVDEWKKAKSGRRALQ